MKYKPMYSCITQASTEIDKKRKRKRVIRRLGAVFALILILFNQFFNRS